MHYSVLLEESISNLNIKEDGIYVDATLGFAGHSSEILKRIQKGYLFAFDQDIDACQASNLKLSKVGNNFKIINDNFVNIKKRLEENNIYHVDGILYDLGVSSPQLDIASRGFSYHNDARLDMRMNQNSSLSAYEVVNNYSEKALTDIFYKYGEEKYAKKIASNIVKYRENKEIVTTLELVDIIKTSVPFKAMRESHPARKVFQAIRIEVNDELNVLKASLEDAIKLLNINGRICVITFHSLEDRIVKEIFNKYTKVNQELNNLPFIPEEYLPNYKLINTKVIIPSNKELTENNRSRSAKLRVIERVK
ncbi:MAG: 16S rRNA (cytosine(1402)-N(4))-methyltransferase RsmH [Tenericutes bacterium]|nr:16S rRNA (cytosine(1402)-N(4))-methyltransferase RsmH [Mycoplasmatota bacterium]